MFVAGKVLTGVNHAIGEKTVSHFVQSTIAERELTITDV